MNDYKEPNLFEVLLSLILGPIFGLIFVFTRKQWSDDSKLTILLLMLFYPGGLVWMFAKSGWDKTKKIFFSIFGLLLLFIPPILFFSGVLN